MKILIVEDEPGLSSSIIAYLQNEQFVCEVAATYASALEKTELYDYACIILDITLPGGSGLDLLRNMKANNKSDGVLIISAKNALDDKLAGLKAGADDYLAKPFHLPELAARVGAIIRRRNFEGKNVIEMGSLKVDMDEKSVKYNQTLIDLTRKEYDLFIYFVSNKNKVISKSAIAEHLWGDDMDLADNHDMIYAHIKNLRKKLDASGAPDHIRSVYGMGYKFVTETL